MKNPAAEPMQKKVAFQEPEEKPQPKPSITQPAKGGNDGSPPRMSIAELAKKINPASIGGGAAANNPLNRMKAEREEAEEAMR